MSGISHVVEKPADGGPARCIVCGMGEVSMLSGSGLTGGCTGPVPDVTAAAFHYNETPTKLIYYECMNPKCKAKDQQKLFIKETTPIRGLPGYVVNCWKCGGGRRGESPDGMLQKRLGMVMIGTSEAEQEAGTQKVTDIAVKQQ